MSNPVSTPNSMMDSDGLVESGLSWKQLKELVGKPVTVVNEDRSVCWWAVEIVFSGNKRMEFILIVDSLDNSY